MEPVRRRGHRPTDARRSAIALHRQQRSPRVAPTSRRARGRAAAARRAGARRHAAAGPPGRAPGVAPATRAGPSIASRRASPASGATRWSPRSASRAKSGWSANSGRKSARTVTITGARLAAYSAIWPSHTRIAPGSPCPANASSNWSTHRIGSPDAPARATPARRGVRARGERDDRPAAPPAAAAPPRRSSGRTCRCRRVRPARAAGSSRAWPGRRRCRRRARRRPPGPRRRRTPVRATGRCCGPAGRRGRRPGGILSEDRALQRDQVTAGVEPQLLAEPAAGRADRGQGVGLAAGAVLREREDRPAALPPRLLAHQDHSLRGHLGVVRRRRAAPRAAPPGRSAAARRAGPPPASPVTTPPAPDRAAPATARVHGRGVPPPARATPRRRTPGRGRSGPRTRRRRPRTLSGRSR